MDARVSAVVLAGGRARRMGGEDKGLVALAGQPMIAHVLAAITPQVQAVAINANRNAAAYRRLGPTVLADPLADFQGPLAGMAAGLDWCPTPLLATLPCDGPLIPTDYIARLADSLGDGDMAVAHDGDRLQPVHALLRRECLPSLRDFLAGGGRKIDRWYAACDMRRADFSDARACFENINTPEQQAAMNTRLQGQPEQAP